MHNQPSGYLIPDPSVDWVGFELLGPRTKSIINSNVYVLLAGMFLMLAGQYSETVNGSPFLSYAVAFNWITMSALLVFT